MAIAALAVIVLAVVAVTPSADLGGGSDARIRPTSANGGLMRPNPIAALAAADLAGRTARAAAAQARASPSASRPSRPRPSA